MSGVRVVFEGASGVRVGCEAESGVRAGVCRGEWDVRGRVE